MFARINSEFAKYSLFFHAFWMFYSMAHQLTEKKNQILFIRNECVCRHGSINKIRHQTVLFLYWTESYCYITIHAITNHHNVKITVYVHLSYGVLTDQWLLRTRHKKIIRSLNPIRDQMKRRKKTMRVEVEWVSKRNTNNSSGVRIRCAYFRSRVRIFSVFIYFAHSQSPTNLTVKCSSYIFIWLRI